MMKNEKDESMVGTFSLFLAWKISVPSLLLLLLVVDVIDKSCCDIIPAQ